MTESLLPKSALVKRLLMIALMILGIVYIAQHTVEPRTATSGSQSEFSKDAPQEQNEEIYVSLQEIMPEEPKSEHLAKPESRPPKPQHFNRYDDASINKGRKIAGDNGQMIGSLPPISAKYQQTLGFQAYASSMNKIGGRFFIIDEVKGEILCGLDLKNEKLTSTGNLFGLSPRSREVDEPQLNEYLVAAKNEYGLGHYKTILLLPLEIDHYIIGAISRTLETKRLEINEFKKFDGVYVKKDDNFYLGIYKGHLKDGTNHSLNISIALQGGQS